MFGFLFKKSKGLDKEGKGSLKQSTKDLLSRRNSTTSATSNSSGGNSAASASAVVVLPCSNSSPAIISGTTSTSDSSKTVTSPTLTETATKAGNIDFDCQTGNNEKRETISTDKNIPDRGGGGGQVSLSLGFEGLSSSSLATTSQMPIPTVLVSSSDDYDCPYDGYYQNKYGLESVPVLNDEDNENDDKVIGVEGGKSQQKSRSRAESESEERCCSSQSNSINGDCAVDNSISRNCGSSLTNLLTCSSGEEICSLTSGIGMSEDALKSLMSDTEIEFIDESLDDHASSCCNNEISDLVKERKLREEEEEGEKY